MLVCLSRRQRDRVKHQQHAEQKQRAQVKRKYIASSSAPSAAFKAQLEATGGIVAVSSLAKNKLDFTGAKAAAAAAANGAPKHTRFDDNGNPAAGQAAAAAAPAAAASNKSAAQLLREKLKGSAAGSSHPPEQQQQAAAAKEGPEEPQQQEQQQQLAERGQDSGQLPEPLTKRVKVDSSQDTDGDNVMGDTLSPASAAAAAAATAAAADGVATKQESQEVQQEGDGAMEDIAALPEGEVGLDSRLVLFLRRGGGA
jgi:hypothetical protein